MVRSHKTETGIKSGVFGLPGFCMNTLAMVGDYLYIYICIFEYVHIYIYTCFFRAKTNASMVFPWVLRPRTHFAFQFFWYAL